MFLSTGHPFGMSAGYRRSDILLFSISPPLAPTLTPLSLLFLVSQDGETSQEAEIHILSEGFHFKPS